MRYHIRARSPVRCENRSQERADDRIYDLRSVMCTLFQETHHAESLSNNQTPRICALTGHVRLVQYNFLDKPSAALLFAEKLGSPCLIPAFQVDLLPTDSAFVGSLRQPTDRD